MKTFTLLPPEEVAWVAISDRDGGHLRIEEYRNRRRGQEIAVGGRDWNGRVYEMAAITLGGAASVETLMRRLRYRGGRKARSAHKRIDNWYSVMSTCRRLFRRHVEDHYGELHERI